MEGLNNINKIESKVETLPIVELEEFKSKRDVRGKESDKIFKFVRKVGMEDGTGNKREINSYFLNEDIGEFKYSFELIEDYLPHRSGNYQFSFETEYEWSRTKITKEENNKLFSKIKSFFESVYNDNKENFKNIWMIFSNTGSTKEEMDTCISEILKLNKSKTKEELLERGKIIIQEEYKKLYGEDFNFTKSSKKYENLRMRLFNSIFRERFHNWETNIYEDPYESTKLILSRK